MNRTSNRGALGTLTLAAAALALVTGCSSSDTTADTDTHAHTDTTCTAPHDTYVAEMMKTGEKGNFMVMMMDSMPAPPSKGDNQWMIMLHDKAGTPVDGATITVTPFMPQHGHGSPVAPVVTPNGSGGLYTVDPVNFSMPGVWEITFTAETPDGTTDDVVYNFCIAG